LSSELFEFFIHFALFFKGVIVCLHFLPMI
jgi:hypothetical protein